MHNGPQFTPNTPGNMFAPHVLEYNVHTSTPHAINYPAYMPPTIHPAYTNPPSHPAHTSTPTFPTHTPTNIPLSTPFTHPLDPYNNPIIQEKGIAGVQSWPAHLLLSLNANNWLDWLRKLMSSLQTVQLDKYPLGLLRCPDPRVDPMAQQTWRGNDCMILVYMRSHMQASETQFITHCGTSAEAYNLLHLRHEKRSSLTQIQLIQRMMQIRFDNNPSAFNTTMTQLHNLIYRAEQIGQVDISKLAMLFILVHLKGTHPSVYEGLSPALMDGTVTLKTFEQWMHHFYKTLAMHHPDQLAFHSLLPTQPTFPAHDSSPNLP